MIRNPYFSRYQQALERSLSAQRSAKKASENDSPCREDSDEKRFEETQPVAVEEQLNEVKKDADAETADKNFLQGFEQIAPGIFKFSHPKLNMKGNGVPPVLYPSFQSGVVLKSQKDREPGFIRVDGLPGPYQHYSTPVFQFT